MGSIKDDQQTGKHIKLNNPIPMEKSRGHTQATASNRYAFSFLLKKIKYLVETSNTDT